MAKTVSLLNMKGGVGKTTLAVNLAWHFYQNEKANVLLVDLDPQFNSTQYTMNFRAYEAHRKSAGTIVDLLIDPAQLDLRQKKLKSDPALAFHTVSTMQGRKFDLLPAELNLAWVVKNPAQMEHRLERLLSKVRDKYDFVFVDCAPTDSVLTTMALTASDSLLIPMRPDRFSLLGYVNLMETISTFKANCPDPHEVAILGIVFTQVMGNSNVEEQAMSDVKRAASVAGTYLFQHSLEWSKSFIRSIADQTPIFKTVYSHPKSRMSVANIASEIKLQMSAIAQPAKGKA